MAKGTFAVFIAAVASAMASAVFQISTTVGSVWIRQNLHRYVWVGWVVSGALWLWWLLAKAKEVGAKQPGSVQPSAQIPININLSHTLSPIVSQTVSPSHSNRQTVSPPAYPPSTEPPKLRLSICGSEMPILMFRMGHWSIYASGTPSVIVWVENKAANEGESCEAISGVVAAISYRDSDGRTLAQIARAYWLNDPASQIDIGAGERKAIVLGTLYGRDWKVYENSYIPPIRLASAPELPHFPAPREFTVVFNNTLVIVVSIINVEMRKTIKKFTVEFLDKGGGDRTITVNEHI
jgi:hypothetical protein